MNRIERYPDGFRAAAGCGRQILEWLDHAIAEQGQATLAVSGGSSPRPMFEMFARTKFPWDQVHLFWVDERGVAPTDAQSNFKLAEDTWLEPAHFPRANVHRIEAELAGDDARDVEQVINELSERAGVSDDDLKSTF